MNSLATAKELFLLALEQQSKHETFAAEQTLLRALSLAPGRESILINLSGVLIAQKKFSDAKGYCERTLAINDCNAVAWLNFGLCLAAQKSYSEALVCFDRAIVLQPNYADAFSNKGNMLSKLGQHVDALANHDQAVSLGGNEAELHCNRGSALRKLGRVNDALASYDFAISLDPAKATLFSNRGNALLDLLRPLDALADFDRAIAIDFNDAEAHSNRGNALCALKKYDDAAISYLRALSLKQDFVKARWNLALVDLVLENFETGWDGFEFRWQDSEIHQHHEFKDEPWVGNFKISGKTILLHAEQGLGDTLQFCRYATKVAALGAKSILRVQPPLVSLLSNLEGIDQVISTTDPLPSFDFHCPLLSLPLAFNTNRNNIPANIPYLRATSESRDKWRNIFRQTEDFSVGLVWSGNSQPDQNRSIPFATLQPLVNCNARFVSLQKEVRPTDKPALNSLPQINDFSSSIDNFLDTAALIELLDLVISVDTSVAHLAGAMGKAVWLLLPFSSDWRWLLDRFDSPWYPSMRLFRQSTIGGWDDVIRSVRENLESIIAFHVAQKKVKANQMPRFRC